MVAAVIGALRVNLGLNSAAFRSGLEGSKMSVQDFAKTATAAFVALAGAAAGAFAKVVAASQKADDMSKAAQSLGVPIDELGRLAHGADMSGVAFEDLSKGIKKASQLIQQTVGGATSEGAKALSSFGISLKDAEGNTRNVQSVILDLADKFEAMPNGVEKTSAAMAIFGKSGAQMIPFLNEGSAGIKAMGDEAEKLGLVLTQETGTASELFNDNLARLNKTTEGFWNRILAKVIPSLVTFTDKLVTAAMQGGQFDGVINGISLGLTTLINGLTFAFEHLDDLYDLFKVFVAAKIVMFIVSLGGAFISLAKTVRTAGITLAAVSKIARAKITVILLLAAAVAKLTGTYDDLVGWVEQLGEKLMEALPEDMRRGIDDLAGSITDMGGSIEDADAAASQSFGTYMNAADAAAESFGEVSKTGEAAKTSWEDIATVAQKGTDKMETGLESVGSALRGLIDGTASWNDVLISVVETLGKMAINSFLEATGGFGTSTFGKFLGSLVKGLTGFASGGSFEVGGTGLTDSQLVAFKASPNEVVSVMTPQQQREAQGMGGGVGTVFQQNNKIVIQTPDVQSFKASESQVAARLARLTQRGARNL